MKPCSDRKRKARCPAPARQQGVVLYVALVVMVAMMLAGVAMLRSVGNGVGVAGNLAFKQNATLAADRGAEQAVAWLITQSTLALQGHQTANGYYATWDVNFNPSTFAWDSNPAVKEATADDGAGNRVRWVMHRLCSSTGSTQSSATQQCSTTGSVVTGGGAGAVSAGALQRALYRVTTRVDGPRGTVSYVQVVVY